MKKLKILKSLIIGYKSDSLYPIGIKDTEENTMIILKHRESKALRDFLNKYIK